MNTDSLGGTPNGLRFSPHLCVLPRTYPQEQGGLSDQINIEIILASKDTFLGRHAVRSPPTNDVTVAH